MKQRIITAMIGLVILAVVVLGFETLLLNIVISVISLMAFLELMNAAGYLKYRALVIVSGIYTVVYPFFREFFDMDFLPLVTMFYFLALMLILLHDYGKVKFQDVMTIGCFGLMIPLSFTNVVLLRNNHGWPGGIFCFLMLLGSAWFSDTCAYFTGRACGRHKMSPVISPHKTVEGLIGGLVGSVLCNLALACGYSAVLRMMGIPNQVHYLPVALVTFCGACVSVIGDLTASAIKRQCGVKDFGHIMPGHGGIMDRFDSVLLTSPVVYLLTCFVSLITIG